MPRLNVPHKQMPQNCKQGATAQPAQTTRTRMRSNHTEITSDGEATQQQQQQQQQEDQLELLFSDTLETITEVNTASVRRSFQPPPTSGVSVMLPDPQNPTTATTAVPFPSPRRVRPVRAASVAFPYVEHPESADPSTARVMVADDGTNGRRMEPREEAEAEEEGGVELEEPLTDAPRMRSHSRHNAAVGGTAVTDDLFSNSENSAQRWRIRVASDAVHTPSSLSLTSDVGTVTTTVDARRRVASTHLHAPPAFVHPRPSTSFDSAAPPPAQTPTSAVWSNTTSAPSPVVVAVRTTHPVVLSDLHRRDNAPVASVPSAPLHLPSPPSRPSSSNSFSCSRELVMSTHAADSRHRDDASRTETVKAEALQPSVQVVRVVLPRRVELLCAPLLPTTGEHPPGVRAVDGNRSNGEMENYGSVPPQSVLWRRRAGDAYNAMPDNNNTNSSSSVDRPVRSRGRAVTADVAAPTDHALASTLSPPQWCVTGYECVHVSLSDSAETHKQTKTTAEEKTKEEEDGTAWEVGLHSVSGADGFRTGLVDDADMNEEAAAPTRLTISTTSTTRAARSGCLMANGGVYGGETEAGEEDDEAPAAAADSEQNRLVFPSTSSRRRRAAQRSGNPHFVSHSPSSRRVDTHDGVTNAFNRSSPTRLCSLTPRRCLQSSEVCITLSWLLHACVLPQVAAVALSRCLDAHIDSAVLPWTLDTSTASRAATTSTTAAAVGAQEAGGDTTNNSAAVPFWIAAFCYTHHVQARAITRASQRVHETENVPTYPSLNTLGVRGAGSSTTTPMSLTSFLQSTTPSAPQQRQETQPTTQNGDASRALDSVSWPSWVPEASCSLHVLTALTSTAFVLLQDISDALDTAHEVEALHRNKTTNDTRPPRNASTRCTRAEATPSPGVAAESSAASPPLLSLLCGFRAFCEVLFSDAENKKLCRHLRDRLPMRVGELSQLLDRPWLSTSVAARSSECIPRRTMHVYASTCCASSLAEPSILLTRWPSMLDLVHHLAHVWMRQCFPQLADRLFSFLLSHNPGVVLDTWQRRRTEEEEEKENKIRNGEDACEESARARTNEEGNKTEDVRVHSCGLTTVNAYATLRCAGREGNVEEKTDREERGGSSGGAVTSSLTGNDEVVYDALHRFVHGLLHRWERWSALSPCTRVDAAGREVVSMYNVAPQRPTTAATLQWQAHVNYARVQTLQWALQHHEDPRDDDDVRRRSSTSCHDEGCLFPPENVDLAPHNMYRGGALSQRIAYKDASHAGSSAAATSSPAAAAAVLVDMTALLQLLSLLPTLFHSFLLPQEVHAGLRRSAAAITAALSPPFRSTTSFTADGSATTEQPRTREQNAFHACFRLFCGVACYGASTLTTAEEVSASSQAAQKRQQQQQQKQQLQRQHSSSLSASRHTTTTPPAAAAAADVVSKDESERGRWVCGSAETTVSPQEAAESVWREYVLPLLVRYYAVDDALSTTTAHSLNETNPEQEAQRRDDTTVKFDSGVAGEDDKGNEKEEENSSCSSSQRHRKLLAMADQIVLYALALLQVVREAQRTADNSAKSSSARTAAAAAAGAGVKGTSSASPASSSSSRKRLRTSSSGNRAQHAIKLEKSGGQTSAQGGRSAEGSTAAPVDDDDSSAWSPCSVSSYTTIASTAALLPTAATWKSKQSPTGGAAGAQDKDAELVWKEGQKGYGCGNEATPVTETQFVKVAAAMMSDLPRVERPSQMTRDTPASTAAAAAASMSAAVSPRAMWVVPSLRTADVDANAPAAASRFLAAETAQDADWRVACRRLAQRWLTSSSSALLSPSPSRATSGVQTAAATSSFTSPTPPPSAAAAAAAVVVLQSLSSSCGGHVVHRRDVRRLRAFLLALRRCILTLQQEEQEEHDPFHLSDSVNNNHHNHDGDNEEEEAAHEPADATPHRRSNFYTYLYGVVPPELRSGSDDEGEDDDGNSDERTVCGTISSPVLLSPSGSCTTGRLNSQSTPSSTASTPVEHDRDDVTPLDISQKSIATTRTRHRTGQKRRHHDSCALGACDRHCRSRRELRATSSESSALLHSTFSSSSSSSSSNSSSNSHDNINSPQTLVGHSVVSARAMSTAMAGDETWSATAALAPLSPSSTTAVTLSSPSSLSSSMSSTCLKFSEV